jgi:ActR/RegA family two-component response regulator
MPMHEETVVNFFTPYAPLIPAPLTSGAPIKGALKPADIRQYRFCRMTKVLLVDDDEIASSALAAELEKTGFEVTIAINVPQALRLIAAEKYDVLIVDLHRPGEGLTAVSAIRHANPRAVTLLLSAFPEMTTATQAIFLQANEIVVEPMDLATLVDVIKRRVAAGLVRNRVIESVAQIVDRTAQNTIHAWFDLVQKEEKLQSVPMTYEQRTSHLRQVLSELVMRLRSHKEIGSKELVSVAAAKHGEQRRKVGYSAAMLIEESRMLQVSLFQTLQNNLASLDFSVLLIGVMTIADEIDSQLSQAMVAYVAESVKDALPA